MARVNSCLTGGEGSNSGFVLFPVSVRVYVVAQPSGSDTSNFIGYGPSLQSMVNGLNFT